MLQVEALAKTYAQGAGANATAPVLQSITFDVPKNQFLCVLGASGCGKTTLLRILAGLTKPDSGTIRIDGNQIRGPGQDRSLVFQNYGLLPWRTILRNVEFGLEVRGMPKAQRREICRDYIARVGLQGFEDYYPHQVSGGMQQRVALARALSKEPKLLLMDEPFAAVDMQTRERLQEELLKIWMSNQTTVLFVTHSVDEAIYLGDRVIVMGARPGRIEADIATELPRPRDQADVKSTERFEIVRSQVRAALKSGAAVPA